MINPFTGQVINSWESDRAAGLSKKKSYASIAEAPSWGKSKATIKSIARHNKKIYGSTKAKKASAKMTAEFQQQDLMNKSKKLGQGSQYMRY